MTALAARLRQAAGPASRVLMTDASSPEPTSRKIGNLAMVYRFAARYPGRIACALIALAVSSAATIAIPYGFKRVIDRGFGEGGDPQAVATAFSYLLMIVGVLAVATAFRFYFVSWLGDRIADDVRHRRH
jgi:ATP-binding cassette, subfamily B, bacterial